MEYLFSYGTLQLKSVQIANFGRELKGAADKLPGYVVEQVEITDPRVLAESGQKYHPILKYTGNSRDQVAGTVFEVTTHDLEKADAYEVDDYKRVAESLLSGKRCWVYVSVA
ncbi:gamma-glutamylcyclotransferase family protein [Cellvibrio polysaccharolyticus]|uniref:Gamma-glutamylcyclotransferase n=1 Tax=Cellvibrio polysaccharolyticus TaxID=2082724 RepID=A0A928YTL6_9GAMM|nr:gamma-glutamylcyclotransferase family protein [Cellvibrio polysaccharolyticus]MBE8717149.1 gamma-glutamylcyclotransferase [Cellvibrio polysaccharolyticus]